MGMEDSQTAMAKNSGRAWMDPHRPLGRPIPLPLITVGSSTAASCPISLYGPLELGIFFSATSRPARCRASQGTTGAKHLHRLPKAASERPPPNGWPVVERRPAPPTLAEMRGAICAPPAQPWRHFHMQSMPTGCLPTCAADIIIIVVVLSCRGWQGWCVRLHT